MARKRGVLEIVEVCVAVAQAGKVPDVLWENPEKIAINAECVRCSCLWVVHSWDIYGPCARCDCPNFEHLTPLESAVLAACAKANVIHEKTSEEKDT